ncbi:hypothetical protein MMC10_004347 [Thelotrema lepadinum]|nr:hypothetical protein [Thelotrema lepadinum]
MYRQRFPPLRLSFGQRRLPYSGVVRGRRSQLFLTLSVRRGSRPKNVSLRLSFWQERLPRFAVRRRSQLFHGGPRDVARVPTSRSASLSGTGALPCPAVRGRRSQLFLTPSKLSNLTSSTTSFGPTSQTTVVGAGTQT